MCVHNINGVPCKNCTTYFNTNSETNPNPNLLLRYLCLHCESKKNTKFATTDHYASHQTLKTIFTFACSQFFDHTAAKPDSNLFVLSETHNFVLSSRVSSRVGWSGTSCWTRCVVHISDLITRIISCHDTNEQTFVRPPTLWTPPPREDWCATGWSSKQPIAATYLGLPLTSSFLLAYSSEYFNEYSGTR